MNKIYDLNTAMDEFLNNYKKEKKNKIMIIDANTGQGKTSSAIKWVNSLILNKEKLPDGIKKIKIFYFTPQKNSWPTDNIINLYALKKQSAFLFSQEDTFEYLLKQYKGKYSKEKTINNFIKRLNNDNLEALISNKNNAFLNKLYNTYKSNAIIFANQLMDYKSNQNDNLNLAFKNYTSSLKELINNIYNFNQDLIKKEIIDKKNKAWHFLFELYSSMMIYDDKYSLYIASVDKILHPLETIIYGKQSFGEVKESFGKDTLIIIFIDEWDKAYERIAKYHYKKCSNLTFPMFKTIRQILNLNPNNLPSKYCLLKKDITNMQKSFLKKYPNSQLDINYNATIKMIINEKIVISNNPDEYYNICYNQEENINQIITSNSSKSLLSSFILDCKNLIFNFTNSIKNEIIKMGKNNNVDRSIYLEYLINFFNIEENKILINMIKETCLYDKNIILVENCRNDIKATMLLGPIESRINRLVEENSNTPPTLIIGMSATANYKTCLNNFNTNNIKNKNSKFYKISNDIAKSIKSEYKYRNDYSLENNNVMEIVKVVGDSNKTTYNKKGLKEVIQQLEKESINKLNEIMEDDTQSTLMYNELNKTIDNIEQYTLKNIINICDVLADAKLQKIKNMMLFATNSYQEYKYKLAIKYIYALKLIEKNIITNKSQLINALSKELLFINANSFENTKDIYNSINNWDNCYIITSYSTASRGINLTYNIKKEDLKNKLICNIDVINEQPKRNDKMDIQSIYLQKPAYIIPQIPSYSTNMNDVNRIEIISDLFRLYENKSINESELKYWISTELSINNTHNESYIYPSNCLCGKIAALKTGVQALGRRTRTSYRFKTCYTYIDYDFLYNYPWEMLNNYNNLSENMQINKLIEQKKALN